MPHGDGSDVTGIGMIAAGVQLLMFPGVVASHDWVYPRALGPLKHDLADPFHAKLLSVLAAFEILLGCVLITVRWNRANGPLSCVGILIAAGMMSYRVWENNGGSFEGPGVALIEHAAVMVLAVLHILIFPNAMPPKAKAKDQ